jgi:hypothetical protein
MAENNERKSPVNKGESLLIIYVLRILKQYSSEETPLTAQDVLRRLRENNLISYADNADSALKKIRRYLDTLGDSYGEKCIKKKKGQKICPLNKMNLQ